MPTTTDRIERSVVLQAPRSRVWRALTDSKEFGEWFGVKLDAPFAAGKRVKGQITIPGYTHVVMEVVVDRIEPETLFSYRWHPYAVDPKVDYSGEEPTLVTFRLEDAKGGTKLSVTESGFDAIPPERRDEAFRMNDGGWKGQLVNIERHVAAR